MDRLIIRPVRSGTHNIGDSATGSQPLRQGKWRRNAGDWGKVDEGQPGIVESISFCRGIENAISTTKRDARIDDVGETETGCNVAKICAGINLTGGDVFPVRREVSIGKAECSLGEGPRSVRYQYGSRGKIK